MKHLLFVAFCFLLGGASFAHADDFNTEVEVWGAVGEYQNDFDTKQFRVEVRRDLFTIGDFTPYVAGRFETHHHPVENLSDQGFVGGGIHWKDWRVELVGNKHRFRSSVLFIAPTDVWDIRGGVTHGNRWEEGFKQTGLHVSVGYPITDHITVGGFYDIQNTTMRSVDDFYGAFLRTLF